MLWFITDDFKELNSIVALILWLSFLKGKAINLLTLNHIFNIWNLEEVSSTSNCVTHRIGLL